MADSNPAENNLPAPQNGMPDTGSLIPHIEALIFASDKPLTNTEIIDLVNAAFGFTDAADRIAAEQVDTALEGIVEKYSTEFYPFEVRQSGGGWQFLTKKAFHKTVAQLNGEKFLKKLSGAALETLAIIAYKQPITKGEIESIRGVSSDYSVQKLLEKDLIIISGRNEKMPGHPLVYATSKSFMDYFGINSADDLPKIREVLAEQAVIPAVVNHTEEDEASALVVTGTGELIDAEESAPLPGTNGNGAAGNARLFIDDSHAAGNGSTPPEEASGSEERSEDEAI
jgi:segregation and condensation protein B